MYKARKQQRRATSQHENGILKTDEIRLRNARALNFHGVCPGKMAREHRHDRKQRLSRVIVSPRCKVIRKNVFTVLPSATVMVVVVRGGPAGCSGVPIGRGHRQTAVRDRSDGYQRAEDREKGQRPRRTTGTRHRDCPMAAA
uniref:Uncharacterized protein n=1 Tax=Sipha flava TaxID=143950 RepID=A0A2S2Q6R2_9HEMI